jgi:type IV pilus assembly protein PilW
MMNRNRGLSMIELLVGLAIGSFIIVGAVMVYSQTRNTYTLNETQARLQENGRYALAIGSFLIIGAVTMQANTRKTFTINEQQARLQETARYVFSVIEPEIQMAGNYGYTNTPEVIRWNGTTTVSTQLRTWSTQIPSLPGVLEQCGKHYALDVISAVAAANNSYGLACAALGGGHNGTSDTLTIRYAGTQNVVASAAKYQIQSARLSQFEQQLFVGTPPTVSPDLEGDINIRDMVVKTYYVAVNADNRPGMPALRMKNLTTNGIAPFQDDQEVIRGVEDIQVEFGVDPGVDRDGDGISDKASGYTKRYVPPDNALVQTGQVSAVRLWVRVRAEDAEQGFVNNRTYTYANVNFTPNDGFRRVLMSRTIYLRSARNLEYQEVP